jgi:hypothetical protein
VYISAYGPGSPTRSDQLRAGSGGPRSDTGRGPKAIGTQLELTAEQLFDLPSQGFAVNHAIVRGDECSPACKEVGPGDANPAVLDQGVSVEVEVVRKRQVEFGQELAGTGLVVVVGDAIEADPISVLGVGRSEVSSWVWKAARSISGRSPGSVAALPVQATTSSATTSRKFLLPGLFRLTGLGGLGHEQLGG